MMYAVQRKDSHMLLIEERERLTIRHVDLKNRAEEYWFRAILRPRRTHLGVFWRPLGTNLGILEPTWANINRSWAVLEPTWANTERSWDILVLTWSHLKQTWPRHEPVWSNTRLQEPPPDGPKRLRHTLTQHGWSTTAPQLLHVNRAFSPKTALGEDIGEGINSL